MPSTSKEPKEYTEAAGCKRNHQQYWSILERIDRWLVQFYPMWVWFSAFFLALLDIFGTHKPLSLKVWLGLVERRMFESLKAKRWRKRRTKTIQNLPASLECVKRFPYFLQAHLVKCHNMNINPKASSYCTTRIWTWTWATYAWQAKAVKVLIINGGW